MNTNTKTKYDNCFINQQSESNKSIFSYILDDTKYINKNECNNYTPPFLTYNPTGVLPKSVDIENELKGITKPYTKCESCKYTPTNDKFEDYKLNDYKKMNIYPHNKEECKWH